LPPYGSLFEHRLHDRGDRGRFVCHTHAISRGV